MKIDLRIDTLPVFEPLLAEHKRYRAAYGGRSSGKSHFFAELAVEYAATHSGARILCTREVQKALRESAKQLIEDKTRKLLPSGLFRITEDEIKTPGGGRIVFQGMNNQNADSMKSYEGFDVAWVEEAHTISSRSLQLLRPTIRKPGSEIWFSWNPTRAADAVDAFFRSGELPERTAIVRANWSDNKWRPTEMDEERLHDLKHSPSYRHIWEGDYATVVEGSYFQTYLQQAQEEGRVTELSYDPLAERRAYFDLGIDDAMAIWVCQFVGQRIHLMDYIEGTGQGLEFYVNALRERGHERAVCILPHDGAHRSAITGARFSDHLAAAGFRTRVVPNQGRGAATIRIAALRRNFHRFWFNADPTASGREALGAYHERKDEHRLVGLGPEHDWASHGADAAGLMACDYDPPKANFREPSYREVFTVEQMEQGTAWLGS